MYYLEPHILKQIREINPKQLGKICFNYLLIGQGSVGFIKHLFTALAFNSHQLEAKQVAPLLGKLRGTNGEFKNEIAILLENSLIPQVDMLSER